MRSYYRPILGGLAAGAIFATLPILAGAAQAQTKKQPKAPPPAAQMPAAQTSSDQKPNILFIMGDDIGWMQPSIYHRGLAARSRPQCLPIFMIGTCCRSVSNCGWRSWNPT